MAGVTVGKGISQPQNGYIEGVLSVTTEATTFSINVTTVSGFSNVTSIIHASASLNSGAAVASTVAQVVPLVSWTTTDKTIKVTCDASQSTIPIGIRFVGK